MSLRPDTHPGPDEIVAADDVGHSPTVGQLMGGMAGRMQALQKEMQ